MKLDIGKCELRFEDDHVILDGWPVLCGLNITPTLFLSRLGCVLNRIRRKDEMSVYFECDGSMAIGFEKHPEGRCVFVGKTGGWKITFMGAVDLDKLEVDAASLLSRIQNLEECAV